ncbi:hypothetical protein BKA80DRAFT_318350 [Phyllosticta citrichinensis]
MATALSVEAQWWLAPCARLPFSRLSTFSNFKRRKDAISAGSISSVPQVGAQPGLCAWRLWRRHYCLIPREPARLSTDASGHTSSPTSNNMSTDDNAATLLPHEQMGSSILDSIFPSNGFRTFSREHDSASTNMTRRSLDKFLEKQLGQKDLGTNGRAVLADSTPELRKTTKQTDETLVASRTHSQDADEIEHPFKV